MILGTDNPGGAEGRGERNLSRAIATRPTLFQIRPLRIRYGKQFSLRGLIDALSHLYGEAGHCILSSSTLQANQPVSRRAKSDRIHRKPDARAASMNTPSGI